MSEVIWAPMIAAGSGLVGVAIGSWLTWTGHREMDIKMIEVAVGILAAEPDKTKGLRNWAVDTLAHYSKDVELPTKPRMRSARSRCPSMQMPR